MMSRRWERCRSHAFPCLKCPLGVARDTDDDTRLSPKNRSSQGGTRAAVGDRGIHVVLQLSVLQKVQTTLQELEFSTDLYLQADLRTKEDGEECEEFLAAEAQVVMIMIGAFHIQF